MNKNEEYTGSEIAVIGMSCRFPEASTPEAFWQNICDGKESRTIFSREEQLESKVPQILIDDPEYVPSRGVIHDIDKFDAEFFKYTPMEASIIDPQQRIFLQIAWEALETAGYDPTGSKPVTGLFAGVASSSYLKTQLAQLADSNDPSKNYQINMGNDKDFLATRIAYKLDLQGPVMTVQTACSTSLVASHQACQSLLNGECDMALAGGVTLIIPQKQGYLYQEGMILSPDGQCRPFDSEGNGTIIGNGAGVVVLRRLEDAIEDNDPIMAVIRGSAVNNDGSKKIGYTAPGSFGQTSVIREALSVSEVDAESIAYIETHGTGTILGDPIEMDSLTQVFRSETDKRSFCAVGSIKSNVGHLDCAAGVAGLMKTVLMLQHKTLPPQINFEKPNPEIDFESSPFYVNTSLQKWKSLDTPLRAGVSSFGIGGTNAHLILEEYHDLGERKPVKRSEPNLLLLSGNREDTIPRYAEMLGDHLIKHPETRLVDVLATLNTSRSWMRHRKSFVVHDLPDLYQQLRAYTQDKSDSSSTLCVEEHDAASDVAFMFTGQGSQYTNMGKALYDRFPVFCQTFDRCVELFEKEMKLPLKGIIFPVSNAAPGSEQDINKTIYTQPALFCYEFSLAMLLKASGITPAVLIGHSIGEIVAAAYANVFSLEDAVKLVSARCSLMQNLPIPGQMASVFLPVEEVRAKLKDHQQLVSIAAVNAPGSVVISGDGKTIDLLTQQFTDAGVKVLALKVSHAFHSPLMDPMLKEFKTVVSRFKYSAPDIQIISNLTGANASDEMTSPNYWVKQVRQSVLFADGITTILSSGKTTIVEIGPRPVLSVLGKMTAAHSDLENEQNISWINCAHPGESDENVFLTALGELWSKGCQLDITSINGDVDARRISLPTYPFALDRHWFESGNGNTELSSQDRSINSKANVSREVAQQPLKREKLLDNRAVRNELINELKTIAGISAEESDLERNFFHLGIDSLMLVRIRQFVKKKYTVEIPMGDFYDKVDNTQKLIDRICSEATIDIPTSPLMDVPGETGQSFAGIKDLSEPQSNAALYERVVAQQLDAMQQLMKKQLAALPPTNEQAGLPQGKTINDDEDAPEVLAEAPTHLSMFQHLGQEALTDEQQRFLDEFLPIYMEKTPGSKQFIASNREGWCDWINAVNFRFALKEILYPIVAKSSKGSRFRDVDGNEYLDLAMGYGVNFLGHNPDIVSDSIKKQLEDGYQLGPQFHLTGAVVQLIRDLTGVDRVAFANTGTEAIMGAVRIARTVTHRKKIIIFSGSYHGWYDGVLVTPVGEHTVPAFRGINSGMVEDVVMLHYGDESALRKIREFGDSVAAVLVEPVQSRRPGFQPREFLHELREVTTEIGAALIFDEIITGFRIHPGGAQAHFDVKADIITYGKVIGGGMPVGIVSGSKKYLDALDGGQWNFGDDSYPTRDTTMFAGTFCKHPLTMRVMLNVLTFLKDEGPGLQEGVNKRTDQLVRDLNDYYEAENVPIRMRNFGSVFRFESYGKYDLTRNPIEMEIFFYILNHLGVYTWERHICFLSIQHTDEDIATVVDTVKMAISKLRGGGFTFSSED